MTSHSLLTKKSVAVDTREVEANDWNETTFFPFQQDRERKHARIDQHAPSFPTFGIGALMGAIILIVLSGVILLVIQGPAKIVSDWTVQVYHTHRHVTIPKPAAWLSGVFSGISVCFHIALAEGLNIAWWYHVQQEKATLRDLHDIWGHGTSTWTVVQSGAKDLKNSIVGLSRRATNRATKAQSYIQRKHFSYVALATLFVATIPLNGFLLQNAVIVTLQPTRKNGTISVPILSGDGFNNLQQVQGTGDLHGGGVSDWSLMLGELSHLVTSKVVATTNLGSFNTTCLGSCEAVVAGMGFRIQCEDSVQPYDFPIEPNNYNNATYTPAVRNMSQTGANIVEVAVTYNHLKANRVTLRSMWKDSATCQGNYSIQTCHLDLATVRYPVVINTGVQQATKTGLRDTTSMTLNMDLLRESPDIADMAASYDYFLETGSTASPVAGLAGLFAQTLNSTINLRYDPNLYYGYSITAQGLFAQQQLATTGNFDGSYQPCHGTIGNVTQAALASIKSMMFQMGAYGWLSSWGSDDPTDHGSCRIGQTTAECVANHTPQIMALNSYQRQEYSVVWPWYFGALAVTILVSMCILPTFWGYWRLERKTTMSPFETARAFHAPVLYQEDSTVQSADLIQRVGDVQIHRDLPLVTMPRQESLGEEPM